MQVSMSSLRLHLWGNDSSKIALFISALLAMLLVSAWHWNVASRLDLTSRLSGTNPGKSPSSQEGRPDDSGGDYVQHLPVDLLLHDFVSQFQRSSANFGVTFVSVDTAFQAPTANNLGRTELHVKLRGKYVDLKAALAETMSRFPNLIPQHLVLRRLTGPEDLEAAFAVVAVAKPLGSNPGN